MGLTRRYTVNIEEDSPARLTLHQWPVTLHFDSQRHQFWRGTSGRMQPFTAVRHVEIKSHISWWQNRLPIWVIRLRLVSGGHLKVGLLSDDADASIVAARLATMLSCAVRSG